jgi:hypothetical protein
MVGEFRKEKFILERSNRPLSEDMSSYLWILLTSQMRTSLFKGNDAPDFFSFQLTVYIT